MNDDVYWRYYNYMSVSTGYRLSRCPLCGGTPALVRYTEDRYRVECINCESKTEEHSSAAEAMKEWEDLVNLVDIEWRPCT